MQCGFCNSKNATFEGDGECEICEAPLCDKCLDSDNYIDKFQVSPYPGEYICYTCQKKIKNCKQCYNYLINRLKYDFLEPCSFYPH